MAAIFYFNQIHPCKAMQPLTHNELATVEKLENRNIIKQRAQLQKVISMMLDNN